MLDILIKNGFIYDGKENPGQELDVGIKNDSIVFKGKTNKQTALKTIEAKGLIVAPGFIDIHGHSDFRILKGKTADSKIRQGVTTEVIGNCGFSAFPIYNDCQKHMQKLYPELKINWKSLAEYISKVEQLKTAINLVPLVGHGNLRAAVAGYQNIALSKAELNKMRSLLEDSLKEGAFGFSSGLIYPPGTYASTEELGFLSSVVNSYGGIYTTHLRSEGDKLLEAVAEAIEIGKKGQIPVQISHLKAGGKRNWTKIEKVFEMIEKERENGRDITCDRYPYTASATDLDSLLPVWTYAGGSSKELDRLSDQKTRQKITQEIETDIQGDQDYWKRVRISSVTNQNNYGLEGKSIQEIAEGLKKSPVDTLLDILIEEKLQVSGIFFMMDENNLEKILNKKYVMVGSDSSIRYEGDHFGKSHPRAFGTFPKAITLGKSLKLPLETMLYKMTGFPARKLGLKKRGIIEKEAYADIVIFDLKHLKGTATYENPHQYPSGISYVLVNGKIVLEKETQNSVLAGRVLRKGKDN